MKAFSTAAPHGNVTATTPIPEYDQREYIFTPATWYLLSIIGIFVCTAILHGTESWQLIHGIWYFLCLPSGFVLLTIYSVANLTDRSWGKLKFCFKFQENIAEENSSFLIIKLLYCICYCIVSFKHTFKTLWCEQRMLKYVLKHVWLFFIIMPEKI